MWRRKIIWLEGGGGRRSSKDSPPPPPPLPPGQMRLRFGCSCVEWAVISHSFPCSASCSTTTATTPGPAIPLLLPVPLMLPPPPPSSPSNAYPAFQRLLLKSVSCVLGSMECYFAMHVSGLILRRGLSHRTQRCSS